jgi:hypothetical protein
MEMSGVLHAEHWSLWRRVKPVSQPSGRVNVAVTL